MVPAVQGGGCEEGGIQGEEEPAARNAKGPDEGVGEDGSEGQEGQDR